MSLSTVVAALLLAACRPPAEHATPTPQVTATIPAPTPAANRVTDAAISDPRTFNPILSTDNASTTALDPLFDGLVRLDPLTTEVEPALAERWEYNPEGTVWTFHLHPGVLWHDGTLDAIYDPRVPNSVKHTLTIDGQRIAAEVLDAHRIRLTLPHAFAPLLNSIGFDILPKHLLGESLAAGTFAQQWGIDTPPERIVGTGPYRLSKYVPAQYLQYQRFDRHWRTDENGDRLPYVPERITLVVPDQDTAFLKFRAGELDLLEARAEDVASLRALPHVRVDQMGLDTGTTFVTFNRNPDHYVRNGKRDPRLDWFTDKTFLRAIAHAIDKASMVQNCLFGYGAPAVAEISPENTRFHNPQLGDYPYDLEKAQQLLTEGGYVDRDADGVREDRAGNPVEFTLHTNSENQVRQKMSAILKEDWTKLGLKVHYRPLEFTTLVEKLDSTYDWDAILLGFTGGVEPHNGANVLRSNGNLHLWHPRQATPATPWEKEIDELIEAGAREMDAAKRQQIYWRIQAILHHELAMIQTVHAMQFLAARTYVQNLRPTVWGLYRPERIRVF
jgi:peptide/nickel transport system substrate-binding protein